MTALFLSLVALFAWAESKRDDRLIREGKPIDHKKRWKHRFLVACWLCFALVMVFVPKEVGILNAWKTFALLLIAAGALFSSVFRYLLNKKRGLHWAYVSPISSTYDAALFEVADMFARIVHSHEVIARRGGRIGYGAELLLTLAAITSISAQ